MERRTLLKGAAWSVPVVALSIASPQAAASTMPRTPVSCIKLDNHGHGGNTGNEWWVVYYSDGTSEILDNGTVMRNKTLKGLCKQ